MKMILSVLFLLAFVCVTGCRSNDSVVVNGRLYGAKIADIGGPIPTVFFGVGEINVVCVPKDQQTAIYFEKRESGVFTSKITGVSKTLILTGTNVKETSTSAFGYLTNDIVADKVDGATK